MCGTLARYVRGVNSIAEDNKTHPPAPSQREKEWEYRNSLLKYLSNNGRKHLRTTRGITHTTPLSIRRGVGGEAFFFPPFPFALNIFLYICTIL